MDSGFWASKRVLVTGHTGFKGSWLSLWLRHLGADVFGYALPPPTVPNLFTIASVADAVEHKIADVRNASALVDAMRSFAPDVVFHLAAQPIVRDSYRIPAETYETNVMGTVNVLEAVRATPGVKATVVVTSDKCYENRETTTPYRETDPMGGYDPYSSSKGCAELVAQAYGRSFFLPHMNCGSLATVRAGNVIGGGDWASDRLMADLMRGLIAGEDVIIRRPRAVRPWQHVLEPLSGYLETAEQICKTGPLPFDSWNFGPQSSGNRTVAELAALTCSLWSRPEAMKIREDPSDPHEAGLLTLDSTKASAKLGWKPRWGFEACVKHTVDWYRAYAGGGDMRSFSLDQIEAYERAAALD